MASVGITHAKAKLNELVTSASRESVVIMVNNKPRAVLMGISEYRALMSLKRLAANPQNLVETAAAYERIERGDYSETVSFDAEVSLDEALAKAKRELAVRPSSRSGGISLKELQERLEQLAEDASTMQMAEEATAPLAERAE